ncbi:hypothetical protein J2R87_003084 [Bradyrhizobium elkanii]|uniref:Uncharacterized protein n=1 Tax=Bradyrhizobium elkanii TaxID=29448 RepID=A0A8I1YES5_BRAEL|nr:hypothetical protein [Bradyrhizobium elkanii]MCP1969344.1 hypothetical protein [Bradyrhizobium elkanii]MCS4109149.1 hypothetical protein [Bradyrhizobium elkanii]
MFRDHFAAAAKWFRHAFRSRNAWQDVFPGRRMGSKAPLAGKFTRLRRKTGLCYTAG